MPPKAEPSPEVQELITLFKSIGLTQAKAAEAAKSPKGATVLKDIIETHALVGKEIDEKQAGLLAALAVQGSKLGPSERAYAVDAILDGRLKSTDQVSGECTRYCLKARERLFSIQSVEHSCFKILGDESSPNRPRRF